MNCPACGAGLRAVRCSGIDVDLCVECRGIWFDKAELNPYLEHWLEAHPDAPYQDARLFRDIAVADRVKEADRACPRCATPMRKFNYSYDSNIILDRCPQCEGIWADKHEVRRMAIFLKGNPKLDRMAHSLAEHALEEERFKEMCRQVSTLSQLPPTWALFLPRLIVPLCDSERNRHFPGVVVTLFLVNFAVAVAMLAFAAPDALPDLYNKFGLTPEKIWAGQALLTFLTYQFVHANTMHFLGNMLFLCLFGDNVEDRLGHFWFIVFYLTCGVGAAVADVLAFSSRAIPSVGASGAISGILAAYFFFYPRSTVKTFVWYTVMDVPAAIYIGLWILMQVLVGVLAWDATRIGYIAHIGGFFTGLLFAFVFWNATGRQDARDAASA